MSEKVSVQPLDMLFFDECFCKDVNFGSYDNTVGMAFPFDLDLPAYRRKKGDLVSIDTCIATEIAWLWKNNVVTINSCCGHRKSHSWVIVAKNSEEFMDKYYEHYTAPSGINCYLLKTGYSTTLKELNNNERGE